MKIPICVHCGSSSIVLPQKRIIGRLKPIETNSVTIGGNGRPPRYATNTTGSGTKS
jgi:hypothetical protein